ncbi:hypothetical protein ES705_37395 [subsurface metagenome]
MFPSVLIVKKQLLGYVKIVVKNLKLILHIYEDEEIKAITVVENAILNGNLKILIIIYAKFVVKSLGLLIRNEYVVVENVLIFDILN